MSIQSDNTKFSDGLYVEIIKTYLDTESVKDTAKILKTSVVKVRKVLITEKMWSSRTSLEIQHYLDHGKNTTEIANILCTTEKAVQQYLPYTKGIYKGDSPTSGALYTAEYRDRINTVREKILKRDKEFDMSSKWNEVKIESEESLNPETVNQKVKSLDQRGYLRVIPETDISRFMSHYLLDPIRLHLELVLDDEFYQDPGLSEELKIHAEESRRERINVLHKYAGVNHGTTISRDVIVPEDMPLWALNYVIQKCFGWQNSHLHCFELPAARFKAICDGESKKFIELMGVVFRSLWMDVQEEFWTDDYESGSFSKWLRSKYTGPYESLCHAEGIWRCKQDAEEIKARFRYVSIEYDVFENGKRFYGHPSPITKKRYDELKSICPSEVKNSYSFGEEFKRYMDVYKFNEIPFDSLIWMSESSANRLLERLTLRDVMVIHGNSIEAPFIEDMKVPSCYKDVMTTEFKKDVTLLQKVDSPIWQPFLNGITDELLYCYDFGDGWKVRITASAGADDLVSSGRITQNALDKAVIKMMETWRPVCIAMDGLNVLDDVGGVNGYIQFLRGINQENNNDDEWIDWTEEYGNYGNKEDSLIWAKSLGWSPKMKGINNLL